MISKEKFSMTIIALLEKLNLLNRSVLPLSAQILNLSEACTDEDRPVIDRIQGQMASYEAMITKIILLIRKNIEVFDSKDDEISTSSRHAISDEHNKIREALDVLAGRSRYTPSND